jgi:hypothetical protein
MADIAAQLAAHDDHIKIYSFWYAGRRNNLGVDRAEFLSLWDGAALVVAIGFIRDVMNARANAEDEDIAVSGGLILEGYPLDYPTDMSGVNVWFANDTEYEGGIEIVAVSL